MYLVGDTDLRRSLRTEQLFEQQVDRKPDAIALTFNGRSSTYSQLALQAEIIAVRLKTFGAGPGTLVGICMDRCSEMVAAMLGVLKAGAAYLPIDAAFPPDRIAFMQNDAHPLVMISQPHLCERLDLKASQLLLLDGDHFTTSMVELPEPTTAGLDDLAYVLYTSGSTGKPKGVQITHRALTNLLVGVSQQLAVTESDVLLATSTISFDISVFEIFAPLIAGARLVIAERSVAMSGELLAEAIRATGATMLQATPSGWRILLESGWQGQPGLKMLTAGEPLDIRLAERLLERGSSLWNLYGPTEATIYAAGKEITRDQTRITIGKALPRYTAHVLDGDGQPAFADAVGELYLGGVGISPGYLNRPELTAEKFIPDLFMGEPGEMLYRTGDLARFLPNGEVELLGRSDNQVKLRGQRIELEEIEAALDRHPFVLQSIVKVVTLGEFDERLVAYVVPKIEQIREDELHLHLAGTLPAYMVPASFIQMKSFELTPGGKVDRNALPVPSELKYSDPVNAPNLRQMVLSIWRMVLGVPNLDEDTNFFYAGGHSLLAVRVCSKLSDCLELKIPVSWLIEFPTARSFAGRLRENQGAVTGCIVAMQKQGRLAPIYLIHHLLGDILVYRSLAECFTPDRPVYGIQAPEDLTARSRPYSLSALAGEYISEILRRQSEGPYHLGGYSSGAVLAFEMARQLTEAGHQVGLLAFIDGDIRTGVPASQTPFAYWRVFVRKMCKVVFKFSDETRDGLKFFVARRVGYVRFLLRIRKLEKTTTPGDAAITLEQALRLTENSYQPEPYSGSALLLRFHDEAARFGPNPLMGWKSLIHAGIEAVDLPGGHITGMNPERAPGIAHCLKVALERVEAEMAAAQRVKGDCMPQRAIPV